MQKQMQESQKRAYDEVMQIYHNRLVNLAAVVDKAKPDQYVVRTGQAGQEVCVIMHASGLFNGTGAENATVFNKANARLLALRIQNGNGDKGHICTLMQACIEEITRIIENIELIKGQL